MVDLLATISNELDRSKSIMFRITVILSSFLILNTGMLPANEPADLHIKNGKIIDGSGNPWFFGDVVIQKDRITQIGKNLTVDAKQTIDAKGLVVAPGFIDIHSHSDTKLIQDGHAQSKIRQGVTTEILGEGTSGGPNVGNKPPARLTVNGKALQWRTLGDYFNVLEQSKISTNVASYVGIGNIWESVMGKTYARPSEGQLKQMEQLLAQAMEDGALGLSSQVMFPPGSLATTGDLVRFGKVIKPYGGIYSSHIRNEGLGVFDAVREAIKVGEDAGIPVDIIHIKIADQQFWGRMNEVIALIESARKRGVNVQANVYPYTRGNNNLMSIIPPWAHEGGKAEMIRRLKTSADRNQIKHDIENGIDGWYNHYTAVGKDWSRMLVAAENQYRGMTMDRVLAILSDGDEDANKLDLMIDFLIDQGGSVATVFAHHTDRDMTLALKQPWCSVGSDGSAYAIEGPLRKGNPHPRNFGTFPRLLGRYVRQEQVITLEDAIRKITSLNAAKIGLKHRGMLQEGNYADITIFDEKTVIDTALFTDPFHYPIGIEYVIVNGTLVLKRGEHLGTMPGRVLRK